MNPLDNPLDRLLRSASRAPAPRPMEASPALEARVLGAWRRQTSRPDWFDDARQLRRGFAFACAAAVAVMVLAVGQFKAKSPDAWEYANTVANATFEP